MKVGGGKKWGGASAWALGQESSLSPWCKSKVLARWRACFPGRCSLIDLFLPFLVEGSSYVKNMREKEAADVPGSQLGFEVCFLWAPSYPATGYLLPARKDPCTSFSHQI